MQQAGARLPDSRHGFLGRGLKMVEREPPAASLSLREAKPRHQRESREILPTMYKMSSI